MRILYHLITISIENHKKKKYVRETDNPVRFFQKLIHRLLRLLNLFRRGSGICVRRALLCPQELTDARRKVGHLDTVLKVRSQMLSRVGVKWERERCQQ